MAKVLSWKGSTYVCLRQRKNRVDPIKKVPDNHDALVFDFKVGNEKELECTTETRFEYVD